MSRPALVGVDPPVEWTLVDLGSVLWRRRLWIIGSLAFFCGLALLDWCLATPRYRATAVLEIQKESHGAFGLDNTTTDQSTTAISDSFDDNLTLQTEVSILQSDALTLDVIRRAELEATPDYFGPRPGGLALLHRLAFWRKPLEPLSTPLPDAPNRRYAALKIFAAHRKIAPESGTRLIAVSYSDPDPARAARIVQSLIQALSDYGFQSRSLAAAQSASWLSAQLAALKQKTDTLDARAAALDRASGDYGDDPSHNPILARLDTLNTALSTAESNRIVREAIWRAVQSGDAEALSGLGGSPGAGANTQNSFALLQSLRAQEAQAQAQLAESDKRYGANWPALAEQRARVQALDKSIQNEVRRLGERAHTDYDVAVQDENSARTAFDQQKDLASRLTGDAVALRLARQEADQSRDLYASLQTRLEQTGVLEGLHSGNFTVVSPALVPPPDHPTSPNPTLLAALALVAGLGVGSAAAIARELTDNTIHTAADLEALLDTPVFATVPSPVEDEPWYRRFLPAPVSSRLALEAAAGSDFALPAPPSAFAEALHRLRASLLLSHSSRAPQVITVTAASADRSPLATATSAAGYLENESPSLALSLAAVLAQYGAPVLYIDADLRAAPPAGAFPAEPGLSDLLASDQPPSYAHPETAPPLLSVLAAGARPPCPAELVASPRMQQLLSECRDEFSFIVIDSPPAYFADALVLAQQSDAVLVCARAGTTRKEPFLALHDALSRQVASHAVLGVVLEANFHGAAYAHA
ncbi:MAG: Wzz/FepE/Etk N-terminal domain-containing protein [Acidobacteriaceae bacterium]